MNLEHIMLEYFISKMDKNNSIENEIFINKIIVLGNKKEKANDIFLNIDNEWTKEQLNIENEKRARLIQYGGVLLFSLGIFLSIFTFIYNKHFNILFFGLILGGILSYNKSKNISTEVNKKRQLRKLVVKRWN
jgi:uncharacterized membrane protein